MDRVEARPERRQRHVERRGLGHPPRSRGVHRAADARDDLSRLLRDLVRLRVVELFHSLQQRQESRARAAIAVPSGKVRAAEERLAGRRQPGGHRPAAPTGQHLHRAHVDRVEVGPLFPVDLDRDVVRVHVGRDLLVLERLLLHHVAPVTGGVADAEQHGAPQSLGVREGLLAPRIPVDRVVRVLEQVRAGLQDQPVGVLGRPVLPKVARSWLVVLVLRGKRGPDAFGQLGGIGSVSGEGPQGGLIRRGSRTAGQAVAPEDQ